MPAPYTQGLLRQVHYEDYKESICCSERKPQNIGKMLLRDGLHRRDA